MDGIKIEPAGKPEKKELKKALKLWQVVIYGVGIILGAGIYALIGEAAGIAGNAVWLSFVLAAIIAGFTALSYAELSSIFPKSAAEFVYVKKAFNKKSLAFLIGWLSIIVMLLSAATVALGFGGYLQGLIGIPIVAGAFALIAFFSVINFAGIEESAKFNIAFTIIEALGLFAIIVIAIPFFGSVNYFEIPTGVGEGLVETLIPVSAATALIFFAYIGFEDMANIAEETKNARKTIPKALLLALLISTIIYILVALAAVSVVPWNELAESKAPLALVAETAFGANAFLILSIIALFATANTVLILLIVSSRMMYGMAREHSLPRFLARVHHKTRTPHFAILVTFIAAIAFTIPAEISDIAFLANFGIFGLFFAVNVSVIALRFSKEKHERQFRMPLNIGRIPVLAVLGALFCLFMLSRLEPVILIAGVVLLGIGIPVYLVFERMKKK